MFVAAAPLVLALGGTAIAAPGLTASKITRSKVKSIADQQIAQAAPGLSRHGGPGGQGDERRHGDEREHRDDGHQRRYGDQRRGAQRPPREPARASDDEDGHAGCVR